MNTLMLANAGVSLIGGLITSIVSVATGSAGSFIATFGSAITSTIMSFLNLIIPIL